MEKKVLIIGAGPAGLAAAYKLCQQGIEVHVFESDPKYVGGLSKTVQYKGFSFDIGGHRFYTKSQEIEEFWQRLMGDQFLKRKRLSRIYFENSFFNYPLELSDVLLKINPLRSLGFLYSYILSQVLPKRNIHSLEDWLTRHFGKHLYRTFFKSYSEKVWGRPCSEVSADWAAQRINDFNVKEIIFQLIKKINPLPQSTTRSDEIKTLISHFEYPTKGPGMLWEKVVDEIKGNGGQVHLAHTVKSLKRESDHWQLQFRENEEIIRGSHIISTFPIKELLQGISPAPEQNLIQQIPEIQYRDFITVVLMFKQKDSFPDNWIYIHDKSVKVARIQNYKNWSPQMVPSDEYTSYGLEYFCQEGDELWNQSDEDLFALAVKEIKKIGLPFSEEELDHYILKIPKAYPVYDHNHKSRLELLKKNLKRYPHLHLAGRNGMHRYNNQDHSIKTAFLCVDNIIAGEKEDRFDPWRVNQDAIYLEK